MGADVEGAVTDETTVVGRPKLHPYKYTVMADRIECGTCFMAGAIMGAPLTVVGGEPKYQIALIEKLRSIGATITVNGNRIIVKRAAAPQAIDV